MILEARMQIFLLDFR